MPNNPKPAQDVEKSAAPARLKRLFFFAAFMTLPVVGLVYTVRKLLAADSESNLESAHDWAKFIAAAVIFLTALPYALMRYRARR
jgi:hypothetical protein